MARINIEDSIFRDRRWLNFCASVGDPEKALGSLVFLWIEAQKWFLSNGEIPNDAWKSAALNDKLIEHGLAEKTETGVRTIGQNEQFAWLKQRADAGRKGGLNRGQAVASGRLANAKRGQASSSFSFSKEGKEGGGKIIGAVWEEKRHPSWSSIKSMTKGRLVRANTRWQENPSREFWESVVERLAKSSFCNGKNDRGWKANFDFLLKPDTATKALEGFYDDRRQGSVSKIELFNTDDVTAENTDV